MAPVDTQMRHSPALSILLVGLWPEGYCQTPSKIAPCFFQILPYIRPVLMQYSMRQCKHTSFTKYIETIYSITQLFYSITRSIRTKVSGFTQKLLTLALHCIQPVASMPIVDPGAFHVACGGKFDVFRAFSRAKVPHGLDVVVVGQHLTEWVTLTRDDVDNTIWQVRGFKDLVAIGDRKSTRLN